MKGLKLWGKEVKRRNGFRRFWAKNSPWEIWRERDGIERRKWRMRANTWAWGQNFCRESREWLKRTIPKLTSSFWPSPPPPPTPKYKISVRVGQWESCRLQVPICRSLYASNVYSIYAQINFFSFFPFSFFLFKN